MKFTIIVFSLLTFSLTSNAIEVEWYDSGVGDSRNTVVEVSCNHKVYQLVIKKNEVYKSETEIIKWFDQINFKCKGN